MTNELITFLEHVLPVLIGIFIAVLASIMLIRIIFIIGMHFARKKYLKLKQNLKKRKEQYQQKYIPEDKEDTDLFRYKEELAPPKAPPLLSPIEKLNSPEQEEDKKSLTEVKIVDIVKPVGFWTSMILGQKLTYLISSAQLMNKNSNKGFWVSMIEAQERAAGREKGRSL